MIVDQGDSNDVSGHIWLLLEPAKNAGGFARFWTTRLKSVVFGRGVYPGNDAKRSGIPRHAGVPGLMGPTTRPRTRSSLNSGIRATPMRARPSPRSRIRDGARWTNTASRTR